MVHWLVGRILRVSILLRPRLGFFLSHKLAKNSECNKIEKTLMKSTQLKYLG